MTIDNNLRVFQCPKCHYDGRWINEKSEYMKCHKCGKKWMPKKKKTESYINFMDKLQEKVIF